MQEDFEKALIAYNKKTWCKSAVLGFFIGLAVIVPGISGSVVAIIFKLYDAFIFAVSNLFKRFKQCFTFLLPIAMGMIIGLVAGFFTVQKALEYMPFAIICAFAGLMSGAFPAVKEEIRGAKITAKRVVLFAAGLILPVFIAVCSTVLSDGEGKNILTWFRIVGCLPAGVVVGITQIVPGLSASAFLMSIGYFTPLVQSINVGYWQDNPAVFLAYAAFAIGFLSGLFLSSRVLTELFVKARQTAYTFIVGLSLGSIVSMFLNVEIFSIYRQWQKSGVNVTDLLSGVASFAVSVAIAYGLVLFERKRKKRTDEGNVESSSK